MTTEPLFKEATTSARLQGLYPALADPATHKELADSAIKLKKREQKLLSEVAEEFRTTANAILKAHCEAQGITLRRLSQADATVWAYAQHTKSSIATDEWPLQLVCARIPFDDDGNYIQMMSSVHILHILEADGRLTPEQRWNTMRQWRVEDERLHRDADREYLHLFIEAPPTAQSPKR